MGWQSGHGLTGPSAQGHSILRSESDFSKRYWRRLDGMDAFGWYSRRAMTRNLQQIRIREEAEEEADF